MSINSASIPLGATFSPSGGTATNLLVLNSGTSAINAYVASSGVTLFDRTEVSFQTKPPKVNQSSPGGYTQARTTVKATTPKVLANDNRTLNSISIALSVDPETTSAEISALLSLAVNLLNDSDFAALWQNQSLS